MFPFNLKQVLNGKSSLNDLGLLTSAPFHQLSSAFKLLFHHIISPSLPPSHTPKALLSFFFFNEHCSASFIPFTRGRQTALSSAPPWPVKQTSAASVMRAIHLERSRTSGGQRTSGPRGPVHLPNAPLSHVSIVRRFRSRVVPSLFGVLLGGLCPDERLSLLVYRRHQIHGGGHRRCPAEADEGLQRHQHRREEAGGREYSLHQLW